MINLNYSEYDDIKHKIHLFIMHQKSIQNKISLDQIYNNLIFSPFYFEIITLFPNSKYFIHYFSDLFYECEINLIPFYSLSKIYMTKEENILVKNLDILNDQLVSLNRELLFINNIKKNKEIINEIKFKQNNLKNEMILKKNELIDIIFKRCGKEYMINIFNENNELYFFKRENHLDLIEKTFVKNKKICSQLVFDYLWNYDYHPNKIQNLKQIEIEFLLTEGDRYEKTLFLYKIQKFKEQLTNKEKMSESIKHTITNFFKSGDKEIKIESGGKDLFSDDEKKTIKKLLIQANAEHKKGFSSSYVKEGKKEILVIKHK